MPVKPIDGATPPVDPATFAAAHRRLLEDRSIQFDLPRYEPPAMPTWLHDLGAWLKSAMPFFKLLFWLGVAALILFVLHAIFQWASGREWRWWRRREAEAAADWRPDEAPARRLLAEADGLAQRGLFSEAAHLLLFRSIADIDARRPDLVRPALTSRDIAALTAIPDRPRGAFARIAALVERSLFALRPLGEGDWRDARAAYEEFAFAEGWRG
jgi:hypothetical protein